MWGILGIISWFSRYTTSSSLAISPSGQVGPQMYRMREREKDIVIYLSSCVIHPSTFVICLLSFIICHSSFIIAHSAFIIHKCIPVFLFFFLLSLSIWFIFHSCGELLHFILLTPLFASLLEAFIWSSSSSTSQLIGSVSTFLIFQFVDLYTSNCKQENFAQYLEFQVGVWVYVCLWLWDIVSDW